MPFLSPLYSFNSPCTVGFSVLITSFRYFLWFYFRWFCYLLLALPDSISGMSPGNWIPVNPIQKRNRSSSSKASSVFRYCFSEYVKPVLNETWITERAAFHVLFWHFQILTRSLQRIDKRMLRHIRNFWKGAGLFQKEAKLSAVMFLCLNGTVYSFE